MNVLMAALKILFITWLVIGVLAIVGSVVWDSTHTTACEITGECP